jgi:hypothetical protein
LTAIPPISPPISALGAACLFIQRISWIARNVARYVDGNEAQMRTREREGAREREKERDTESKGLI